MATFFDDWLTGRFMAQPVAEEESYISDGLVFRIDGKKRGTVADTITDLVGGMQFINHGVTFANNGIVFNGSACFSTKINNILPANSDYTVEIAFRPGATGTQYMFGSGDNDHADRPMVVLENSRIHLASSRSPSGKLSFEMTSVVGSPFIVSGNHTSGVINGVAKSISTYGDYWTTGATDRTSIGARYTNAIAYRTFYTGTIYAIRIYNRRLTEAEMLYNQQIDNMRFNLGLTINA